MPNHELPQMGWAQTRPQAPHPVALGTLPLSAHCRSYTATGAASGQGRPRSHIWCRLSTRERTREGKHFSYFLLS